jgi:hypothetical protein
MGERESKNTGDRQRRNDGDDRDLRSRDPDRGNDGQTLAPAPMEALLRHAKEHPEEPGLRPLVARQLLGLQATHGNAYVARSMAAAQRQVALAPAVVSKEDIYEGAGPKEDIYEGSAEAPGLSEDTVKKVARLIKAGKRQKALNAVISDLAGSGKIDLALLKGGKMHYRSSISDYGEAIPPGFKKDPKTGKWKSKPTPVNIGRPAFKKGISFLYSTIMHEYQHVLQFQERGAKGTKGQVALNWLILRQEVEAYAWEILHSKETGLFKKPKLMRATWRALHKHHWLKLGRKSRRLLNDLYVKAHKVAQAAVGKKWKLPSKPAPATT